MTLDDAQEAVNEVISLCGDTAHSVDATSDDGTEGVIFFRNAAVYIRMDDAKVVEIDNDFNMP